MIKLSRFFFQQSSQEVEQKIFFAYLIWLFFSAIANPTSAQIIPDNTLPNNSIVTPSADILPVNSGTTVKITGGTKVGNNLFHSFQEFSLPQGNIASFDHLATIENIFTRVTGNNISVIDGLIQSLGTADLFFINPNGIILGENASLNIGGSFIGSTANSIVFPDGSEFSAVNPNNPPLLTINAPIGLNLGTESGQITVRGTGNNIYYDNNYIPATSDRPVGFAVNSQKTLALVGNGISLEGGNLTAEQGRVELGSVKQTGIVNLTQTTTGWSLDYQNINNFADINLTQAASVDASGNSGGIVQLTGKNISLTDGSVVLVETLGDGNGGLLNVRATDTVKLLGDNPDTSFWTSFLADTVIGSTGQGGNINIKTQNLHLIDGGQITSVIYGEGDGGNIDIEADEINISGFNDSGDSGLFASAEWTSTGKGGKISINTQNLNLSNEGNIIALTWGAGDAGSININARQISINDSASIEGNAEEFSLGNGADINLTAQNIFLSDGGQIAATTFSEGSGGNININAERIELIGASDPTESFATAIASGSRGEATGNAGTMQITAQDLILQNGAQLNSATTTSGDGGNLIVKADDIKLSGFHTGAKSGFVANAVTGTGNGGDIQVTTNNLSLLDGAVITVSNFSTRNPDLAPGEGMAGKIDIQAQSIHLDSSLADEKSSINASTFFAGGGNIILNAESITAFNNSQITAETQGEGAGGSIQISTEKLDLRSSSLLTTSTHNAGNAGQIKVSGNKINLTGETTGIFSQATVYSSGDGGLINLTAEQINIRDRAAVSSSSTGLGQAGNIQVNSDRIETNQGLITATSQKTGGGDINFSTELIRLENNSLISTSVLDSNGGGGNIAINNSNLILARNNSDIRANAKFGSGGNININTELIFTDLTSDIDASSKFGLDGVVEIKSPESEKQLNVSVLPENIVDPTGLLTASCPISDENNFAITGNGGIPNSPYSTQSLNATWYDLRPIKNQKSNLASPPVSLQEATATIVNARGQIELIALTPLSNYRWVKSSCSY